MIKFYYVTFSFTTQTNNTNTLNELVETQMWKQAIPSQAATIGSNLFEENHVSMLSSTQVSQLITMPASTMSPNLCNTGESLIKLEPLLPYKQAVHT